jgi:hypothetical protein
MQEFAQLDPKEEETAMANKSELLTTSTEASTPDDTRLEDNRGRSSLTKIPREILTTS